MVSRIESVCTGRLGRLTACLVLVVLAALPARAEYRQLDAIVAVVNDDVVLASELLSRLDTVRKQIAESDVQAPPDDVLVSQIMERLILESLQLQEAERRGLEIDDETLTRAVASFAQDNNLSLEQFRAVLAQDGIGYAEFREQIRREMIMSRLQRNLVSRRIAISDKDIDDLLDSPYYQQLLSDEYRIGHILLTIDENADDAAVEAARAEARRIVAELREGANFREMAIANSSASTALEGGDLGWRKAGELPSLFAEEVLELDLGETADPIETAGGIHIVQLLDVRGASTQSEQQARVRHILVQPSAIRTEAETRALIEDIHQRLQDGADFAALAEEYSEDPGSALNGGDLGWTSGNEFVAEFQQVLADTPTGDLSEPFRSQYGWHVLEVTDRREQDMSQEARRRMAMQILHQRRFDEELQEWQKELRDEAFVEVRI
ncbi:MAG: molecular chaperone SurA [Gammaproteobacteria bacterium]|nr:molecular chaperone SurA [Gammaproteobacteria bacterium]|tara:strand:- start:46 stop:1359 length:1314 start_codon:yes stop_codon:yes gene_type:complete